MGMNAREVEGRSVELSQREGVLLDARGSLFLSDEVFTGRERIKGLTIDNPTSMDLDDAIWLEIKNGSLLLTVSIADPSVLIGLDSSIDRDAQRRAFTRYYASGNSPMIPRILSEDQASLMEGQRRPTISVTTIFIPGTEIGQPTIKRTYLESTRKLNYESSDQAIQDSDNEFSEMLRTSGALAQRLLQKRLENGAMAVFDLKRGLATTEDGQLRAIGPDEGHISHVIIQEFMILTNQAVARYFVENDIPGLFRNHTARAVAPSREALLEAIHNTLVNADPARISVLRERLSMILNRASYGPQLEGHYALNLPAYMHFTSPIRRYPDLMNVRQLNAYLLGESLPYSQERLVEIADHVNETENEIKDRAKAYFLSQAQAVTVTGDPEQQTVIEIRQARRVEDNYKGQLQELAQKNVWQLPIYEAERSGPSHKPTFVVKATMTIGEQLFVSEPTAGSSIKEAEQAAARNLHQKLQEIGLIRNSEFVVQNIDTVVARPSIEENFKGELQETAQFFGVDMPSYTVEQTGPPHQPQFTVVAAIIIGGQTFTSDPTIGPNRRSAEQLAAADLLGKLPYRHQEATSSISPVVLQGENYVGGLGELLQKNHKSLPVYTFQSVSDGDPSVSVVCVVRVKTPDGNFVTFNAYGANQKEAKQKAAELAFREVSQLYQTK